MFSRNALLESQILSLPPAQLGTVYSELYVALARFGRVDVTVGTDLSISVLPHLEWLSADCRDRLVGLHVEPIDLKSRQLGAGIAAAVLECRRYIAERLPCRCECHAIFPELSWIENAELRTAVMEKIALHIRHRSSFDVVTVDGDMILYRRPLEEGADGWTDSKMAMR